MNICEISYKEFGTCLKVDNNILEIVIPLEFGIRILKLGFINGNNIFAELPGVNINIDGSKWYFYGGHRLWLSPETKNTYYPDNSSIFYDLKGETIKLIQPVDSWSNVVKEISLTLSGNKVRVVHKVTNKKTCVQKLAPWSISVMAPGGTEVVPLNARDSGLLHNRQLSLWSYTRMDDPRIKWFKDYFTLTQDSRIKDPFKIGVSNYEGWGLYVNQDVGFVKNTRMSPTLDSPTIMSGTKHIHAIICWRWKHFRQSLRLQPRKTLNILRSGFSLRQTS